MASRIRRSPFGHSLRDKITGNLHPQPLPAHHPTETTSRLRTKRRHPRRAEQRPRRCAKPAQMTRCQTSHFRPHISHPFADSYALTLLVPQRDDAVA